MAGRGVEARFCQRNGVRCGPLGQRIILWASMAVAAAGFVGLVVQLF